MIKFKALNKHNKYKVILSVGVTFGAIGGVAHENLATAALIITVATNLLWIWEG